MKINAVVIAILIVAIIVFVYFIIKRNRKDQKTLEKELNEQETRPDKHDGEQI